MKSIEQGYIEQGFELPIGWTWERVAAARAEYSIGEIYVPVAIGHGCCAWGVPMRDGRFLSHGEA